MIKVKGFCKLNQETLFSGLDLAIPKGKWTCLLGSSGVGKTTLLRTIAGLPIGGEFIGTLSGVPEKLAYMAQQDLLMPWLNVEQNVQLGLRLRGEHDGSGSARKLLGMVGLAGFERRTIGSLSGGQRQRVALARTLMENRELVLLDEPFSALDARTRSEMQELAANCLKDRTVLMVTHDPGEAARLGNQIYLMTHEGVNAIRPIHGEPPHPFDSKEVLELQTALLRKLRDYK